MVSSILLVLAHFCVLQSGSPLFPRNFFYHNMVKLLNASKAAYFLKREPWKLMDDSPRVSNWGLSLKVKKISLFIELHFFFGLVFYKVSPSEICVKFRDFGLRCGNVFGRCRKSVKSDGKGKVPLSTVVITTFVQFFDAFWVHYEPHFRLFSFF